MRYDLISSTVEKNRVIAHEIISGNQKKKTVHYAGIRGGLSWPDLAKNAPAYYCIWGQEYVPGSRFEGQPRPEGNLVMLAEHQAESSMALSPFFGRLTDDTTRLICGAFYTTNVECPDRERDPLVVMFEKYRSDHNIREPYVTLHQAPYVDDLNFVFLETGDRRERGKIKIPEDTMLHRQLVSACSEVLANGISPQLNAIHAFRYVLASFVKSSPTTGGPYRPKRFITPRPRGW